MLSKNLLYLSQGVHESVFVLEENAGPLGTLDPLQVLDHLLMIFGQESLELKAVPGEPGGNKR